MSEEVETLLGQGSVLVGRYRLDSPRHDSPLAEVWLGHDLVLDRAVVIKVLHSEIAGDELVQRFRAEAISAARLSHPNIVPTFDAGTDDGTAFMVSGYIEGTSLSSVLARGPLPLEIALCIGVQVADALEHAHSVNLVHRDVRPSRLLVVDDDFRVMLTDFGVATAVADAVSESLSIEGVDLGDPTYLSPEQTNDEDVDARADIFAIGRLIHTVGCGQDHRLDDCTTLPASVLSILNKASADRVDDRYPSATELKADLEQLLSAGQKVEQDRVVRRVRIAPPVPPRRLAKEETGFVDEATQPHARLISSAPVGPPTSTISNPLPVDEPAPHRSEADGARRRARKRRNVTVAVVVLTVLAAIGFGRVLSGLGSAPDAVVPVQRVPVEAALSARSFDPQGDGREGEGQVGQAVDGNPATSWSTERYNSRTFGNLKPGVGLILTAEQSGTLKSMTVATDGQGWAAQVFVADTGKADLAAWGQPVDTQSGLGPSANFDLHSANGQAVLLWITDLGSGNKVSVAEVNIAR